MRPFITLVIAMAFLSFSNVAISEAAMLVAEKATTLDLTSKEGMAVDLLECGIYVLEEGGNSYLVHSKGKLPIPKAAVHIWPDEATAEIETTGVLMGLKLVSMMLANFKSTDKRPVPYQFVDAPSNANRNIDRDFPAEEWVISDSGIHFFIAEKESKITKTIIKKLPTARVIPTSELENGREVILLGSSDICVGKS